MNSTVKLSTFFQKPNPPSSHHFSLNVPKYFLLGALGDVVRRRTAPSTIITVILVALTVAAMLLWSMLLWKRLHSEDTQHFFLIELDFHMTHDTQPGAWSLSLRESSISSPGENTGVIAVYCHVGCWSQILVCSHKNTSLQKPSRAFGEVLFSVNLCSRVLMSDHRSESACVLKSSPHSSDQESKWSLKRSISVNGQGHGRAIAQLRYSPISTLD